MTTTAPKAISPVRIDGRRLRSARTRQIIIEAYLLLLRESPQIPTAAAIATRAGYSIRSVFERFPDLHSLRIAATDHAMLQAADSVAERPPHGDRAARLRIHVEMRGRVCEEWLPLWRALNANQGDSVELKARIHQIRELVIRRMEAMYEPELSTLDAIERRQTILAIEALIDFESWARMREFFGQSFEEACAIWILAIDRLLPPTPAVS
ncbi:MAG: TetR/AcrR family transcriptional regulator [Reyranella sp.]|jgi:AcrR family transcriptional regulator|uniref:TetR/AcrR family transcriptional regulator n=1 Tax=Reyranella sp. TaxID=1929291 RepID=UPI0025FCA514|nr:TetR/AcrR family transcriptional regulator [Reyranella sp.]MBR2818866.1 TetR/AcrR family transcriptional regulator [Reyranella sp.]